MSQLLSNDELKAKIGASQERQLVKWLNENRIPFDSGPGGAQTHIELFERGRDTGPVLVLIRGLPGSGKSTMARRHFPDHAHFEADMFFQSGDEYVFDRNRLAEAHEWCREETRAALDSGLDAVVANTFTTHDEMRPYFAMGYPTFVYVAKGEWGSVHGVPERTIDRMRARWEPYRPSLHGALCG